MMAFPAVSFDDEDVVGVGQRARAGRAAKIQNLWTKPTSTKRTDVSRLMAAARAFLKATAANMKERHLGEAGTFKGGVSFDLDLHTKSCGRRPTST